MGKQSLKRRPLIIMVLLFLGCSKNVLPGDNFQVYEGSLSQQNEISRDEQRMSEAEEVSIMLAPAGPVAAVIIISLVVSVAVAVLTKVDTPSSANDIQSSPNNSLSDRRNRARPNQRIVDIVGRVKSIPDIIQREYARYVDNVEVRYGYYCIARNQVSVTDVKDGDSFIADTLGSSAGIYYPNKSPNNSASRYTDWRSN